jgi:hypothetical protein
VFRGGPRLTFWTRFDENSGYLICLAPETRYQRAYQIVQNRSLEQEIVEDVAGERLEPPVRSWQSRFLLVQILGNTKVVFLLVVRLQDPDKTKCNQSPFRLIQRRPGSYPQISNRNIGRDFRVSLRMDLVALHAAGPFWRPPRRSPEKQIRPGG